MSSQSGRQRRENVVVRLLHRDGMLCQICKNLMNPYIRDSNNENYITIDHILPRASGGTDTFDNLQLAHQICNGRRGTMKVEEAHDLAKNNYDITPSGRSPGWYSYNVLGEQRSVKSR